MAKTPVGSVAIRVSNNRLQLVYRYRGKREYLSIGLPESRNNRKYAQSVASQIEIDILAGNYDTTKAKYQQFANSEPSTSKLNLSELWEKYTDYKRPQVSQNTIAITYRHVDRWLAKLSNTNINASDAVKVRDYLLQYSTPLTTRRLLNQLSASCRWAIASGLIANNPFEGLGKDINAKKVKVLIEYFTESERSMIIQYFYDYDRHYAPLVEFVFRCGCRPSEALALEWGDISEDFSQIIFSRSLTKTESGSRIVKKGLKSELIRTVPCGRTLAVFLQSIAPDDRVSIDLVFPSPKIGQYINLPNFSRRHWIPALKQIGLKYRSFYKVRHSAITHALDTLDAKDVAALVGNSADVIYRNYAGVKEGLATPDF